MGSFNWIKSKYIKVISFIEQHRDKIPFSKFILLYLRIPITLRVLVALAFLGITHEIIYIIGFIILQSKGKNEVLSLITAFQNPINFNNELYYYYSFVYLFITLIAIIPFGLALFYGTIMLQKIRSKKLYFSFTFLFLGVLLLLSFSLLHTASLLSYYLFYSSKYSSFWEVAINYIFYAKEIQWNASAIDLDSFQQEVFISLQSGNMAAVLLIFLFFVFRKKLKQSEKKHKNTLKAILCESKISLHAYSNWDFLKSNVFILHTRIMSSISFISYIILLVIFSFAIILIFVSHTAHQFGGFGKNLAQFDTDSVLVSYTLNGEIKKVEGIRIFQDKNYIVVRDSKNQIHYIFTDQIHIRNRQ